MRAWYTFILVIAFLAMPGFRASAQTTKPASADWSGAVQSLAAALAGGDSAVVREMLGTDGTVRPFFGSGGHGLAALLEQAELAGVVSNRAYRFPAATLATDLAEDVRDSAIVREDQKAPMIPADSIGYQRAETTASQWLKTVLGAENGDQIGFIVLWIRDKSGDFTTIRRGRPLFVLAIGDAKGDAVRIRKIVFGNPLDGLRRAPARKSEPALSDAR